MLPLPLSPKLNEKGETFSMEQRSRLDCFFARYLGKQIWSIMEIWFFFLDLNVTYNLRLVSCFRMLARWKVSPLRLEVSTSCWWWLDHWVHPNQNTLRWKMFWCLIMTIPLNIAAWSVSLVSQQESYDTYHGHGRSPVRRNAFGRQWWIHLSWKKMDTIILEEKPISKNGFFKFLPWFSLDLFGH